MEWSPQQEGAIASIREWLRSGRGGIYYLAGYAGTGKTTLARHIVEDYDALFCAFTGKAANVLQSKGCLGATTIHSLIYQPKEASVARLLELEKQLAETPEDMPTFRQRLQEQIEKERANADRAFFALKEDSKVNDADVVVVDECSMVDRFVGHDLESFGTPLLVLGDPAQLPPVMGQGYFTSREPDWTLTEIHRQARDNPIIDLATRIRNGDGLVPGVYGESRVILRGQMTPDMVLGADQVIVGRNKTRIAWNGRIRELLGHDGPMPIPGERLVCLKNDADKGLYNGAIYHVEENRGQQDGSSGVDLVVANERGQLIEVDAHESHFLGYDADRWVRRDYDEFTYGYALTGHKSQGSQWGDVLVLDESGAFRQDGRKWLYTTITRAAERVTVVL